ncbi:hypothetical protein BT69DRAFT_1348053 [Atractiella rhizophila]|nr:hypothetical protein BT69DRAFT_1348053 [Atractiella rhizophila]
MSLCKACVSGVLHEGEATGTIEIINGVKCYIGKPAGDYPKNKALVFLPDAFSIELNNNKLLVDAYAKNGFYTVAIDILDGDAVPADDMNMRSFDFKAWIVNHGYEKTKGITDAAIKGLKDQGFESFGAVVSDMLSEILP